jgi:hypothetical protein
MDLFKGIAIFIGWLTSSLAGIAAILYAFGYLIVRAQLNLLGLFGLFDYGHEYYLQEGAKFFVVLVMEFIGPALFVRLVYLGYILLASLIAVVPLAVWIFAKRAVLRSRLAGVRQKMTDAYGRRPGLWRASAMAILFVLLIVHFAVNLTQFTAPLYISNLLYDEHGAVSIQNPDVRQIAGWLVSGDAAKLKSRFSHLLFAGLEAGLLLAAAWYVAAFWRVRFWLASPFIAHFLIYVIFLPMVYGVLVRPNKYPVITLNTVAEQGGAARSYLLLNKNDQEFIMWDPARKRVLWIPRQTIQYAEIEEIRFLFAKSQ